MKINISVADVEFGTSVNDVVVPSILRKRIPTGLDYFDSVIGGQGFTPSMITYFTGTPGAGKTTLMLTLANSLQKRGCEVVFNSAEESIYQIKMTAERLELNHPFKLGNESNVPMLIKGCDKLRKATPDKSFFLIVDSLQCMDDGHFGTGRITTATADRALQMLTTYAKKHAINIIVIGQVNKAGQMSGSNKLKHMVDQHIHLSIETKDEDLKGARILETLKNRFGGAGYIAFLQLRKSGFRELARIETATL
jgi:DNA repair protein RadA/Sms